ncbi:MAG TPA: hypothetical protein VF692_08735, partial [Pyrinomonadaceae bacterium]
CGRSKSSGGNCYISGRDGDFPVALNNRRGKIGLPGDKAGRAVSIVEARRAPKFSLFGTKNAFSRTTNAFYFRLQY